MTGDPTDPFSDGLRDYYFSAEPGVVPLETIELRHPEFFEDDGVTPKAVRLVNNTEDLIATLEADAPMNAGETVVFSRCAFSASRPEQSASGLPTVPFEIDNVSREVMPYLDLAAASNEPLQLSIREYRSDETDAPGFVAHGLTFHKVSAGIARVTGEAGYEDLLNRPHPSRLYTLSEFPRLAD